MGSEPSRARPFYITPEFNNATDLIFGCVDSRGNERDVRVRSFDIHASITDELLVFGIWHTDADGSDSALKPSG